MEDRKHDRNPKLNLALNYAANGWKVFPLRPNYKMPIKGIRWRIDATDDKTKIKFWWTENPDYNIGLVTGKVSGLTVVDADDKAQGSSTLEAWGIKSPVVIKTPNGYHHYFKYDQRLRTTVGLGPGVDVRNDGGYVVAAGSKIFGKAYSVLKDSNLVPIPEILLTKQQDRLSDSKLVLDKGKITQKTGRNQFLTRIAGSLRKQGLNEFELYTTLVTINHEKCAPPLIDFEVRQIAKSVSRYAPEPDYEGLDVEKGEQFSIITPVELFQETKEYLQNKQKLLGTPTGIEGLDQMLGGGLREGEVTALHAEAKTGKNSLLHKIIHCMITAGGTYIDNNSPSSGTYIDNNSPFTAVGYASREIDPATEVIPNLLSIHEQKNVWLEEPSEVDKYLDIIKTWPLYFATGYGYFPKTNIVKWVDSLADRGVKIFIFDHLHYMLEEPEDHKSASKLARELKALAKEKAVSLILIIQPKYVMEGARLSLSSLRGGAAIGQAIDNLLIMERVKEPGVRNISRLRLEVGRSKLCRLGAIYLEYNQETTDFREVEENANNVVSDTNSKHKSIPPPLAN